VTVGEMGDDGLPEPLQFEISVGLRVMLIPSRGFGWVIGGRKRSGSDPYLVMGTTPRSRASCPGTVQRLAGPAARGGSDATSTYRRHRHVAAAQVGRAAIGWHGGR